MTATVSHHVYEARIDRVRSVMAARGIDALLLSVGHDLPYLAGYHAMPLERLTMFVLPRDGHASLIIPKLEAPRVVEMPSVFSLLPWGETEDPVALTHKCLGAAQKIAVGDQMWARFLVELLAVRPGATYVRAQQVMSALRATKDQAEIDALIAVGAAADRVAMQLQSGDIPLLGRTEAQVSADISARLIAEGHDKVNFAIVAAGENAASPHHHPGSRIIQRDEIVLCDFGGTMNGYCSDITRCVYLGEIPTDVADAYAVLKTAQATGVSSAVVGQTCESVDARTRAVIEQAGYGDYFVHRTGHGIGMEEHEDPYMVSGNTEIIAAGHAFSVEPGIYIPGKWGMRLEDIVVATDAGPLPMNKVNHDLVAIHA
jgi:Xaa-Pro aminopeptidase